MTPGGGGAHARMLSIQSFKSHLLIELVALCANDEVVLDHCRQMCERIGPQFPLGIDRAAQHIVEAKTTLLERLRSSGATPPRIDDFFKKHVKPMLASLEEAAAWRMFWIALSQSGPRCEYLLVDYFVRGGDRPVVPNHWIQRPKCTKELLARLRRVADSST